MKDKSNAVKLERINNVMAEMEANHARIGELLRQVIEQTDYLRKRGLLVRRAS